MLFCSAHDGEKDGLPLERGDSHGHMGCFNVFVYVWLAHCRDYLLEQEA